MKVLHFWFFAAAALLSLPTAEAARRKMRRIWELRGAATSGLLTRESAPSWRPKCRPKFVETEIEHATNHEVEKEGEWKLNSCHGRYFLDAGLAGALASLMEGGRVVELGAGCGCYTGALLDSGKVKAVQAFDGVSNIARLTSGLVQTADLTQNIQGRIEDHDWTLCTEVGEHVPHEFEDVLLADVVGKAAKGVVLSWAVPGQEGEGHVNLHPNQYIEDKMGNLGFSFDQDTTTSMRTAVSGAAPWFKNTLMVFRRADAAS